MPATIISRVFVIGLPITEGVEDERDALGNETNSRYTGRDLFLDGIGETVSSLTASGTDGDGLYTKLVPHIPLQMREMLT